MSETFVAKSGNVALLTVKGRRAKLIVAGVAWDKTPSKKDVRQFNEWFQANHPDVNCLSKYIEDEDARNRFADDLLYGGQRN